jgi:hypothetical protein
MKKRFLVLAIACSFILLTGCGNGSTSSTTPKTTDNQSSVSSQATVTVPGRTPELVGKVKEIIGNEVTVFKAKIETDQGRPAQQRQERASNAVNERQGSPPQVSFTEETETFIIPVGIPVATMQRGGTEAILAQLTDIKKDQIIRVWKTGETVEFIQLTGGSRAGGQQQQGDGGNRGTQSGPPMDTQGGPPMGMEGGR